MALPRNVTGNPRRDRADRRPARPPRPPANRRHGDPGPTHRRGEPRRAPAAPGAAGRDRPARRDAQRHARSARAGLPDPTSLHRPRLAPAPLTPLTSPGRGGGDAPPTPAGGRVPGGPSPRPRRGPGVPRAYRR